MGLHYETPIYKAAYELLILTTEITRNIPRDLKAGLGATVRDECIKLLVLIARANSTANKVPHLVEMLERVQIVDFLLRLLKDKQFISVKQHANAMQITISIGKQATGWKKSAASPAI